MKSNVDQTKRKLKDRPETERIEIGGDTSGVILRALVDDMTDDFESFVEDSLPDGVELQRTSWTPYGIEVEIR